MVGWMVTTLKHAYFYVLFLVLCVWIIHILYVHNVESYSSDLSENGLLNTRAVLLLHHTIQLFMNLNKKVTLLLCCCCVVILCGLKLQKTSQ